MSEQTATTLFSENFDSANGVTPPSGWTKVLLEGNPETDEWRFDNPGDRSFVNAEPFVGPVAIYDSDALSDDDIEESAVLVSPVFSAADAEGAFLQYDQWYFGFTDPDYDSQIYIETSTDGGTTWDIAYLEDGSGQFNGRQLIDLTDTVAGSDEAQIRFRFDGDWSYVWAVDNIEIVDYLPPGVILPTGEVGVSEDDVPEPLDFEFTLQSRPSSEVTLNFLVDDQQLQDIEPITFTPQNWSESQLSVLNAVSDNLDEGENQISNVRVEVVSDDPAYNGLEVEDIPVQITDSTIPGFTSYRTVEETYSNLKSLADSNSDLASWVDIGDSYNKTTPGGPKGYDIQALQLTNKETDIPGYEKPILYVQGAIHAREYTTTELVTRFAEDLVSRYGTDPEATWLLDYTQIHVVPILNPDGRKFAEQGYSWRKNANPDPDPTLEKAPFPTYGVDLNRNYDSTFGQVPDGSSGTPSSNVYRGPFPFSEPETQAARDYLLNLFPDQKPEDQFAPAPDDATGVYLDVHSFGNLVLYPFGNTDKPAPNSEGLRNLGLKFGYFSGLEGEAYDIQQAIGLYPTDGTTDDWVYETFGSAAYTIELGTEFFEDTEYFENTIVPEFTPALYYAAKSAFRPYQTSAGPDSLDVKLDRPTIFAGVPISLNIRSNATRYDDGNLSSQGITEGIELPEFKDIAGARYSFDSPSWVPGTELFELIPASNPLDDTVERLKVPKIDTSGLTPGRHTIFVESKAADGTYGVPTAVFLDVLEDPDGPVTGGPNRMGTDGSDLLRGDGSNDVLEGNLGNDILLGGNGRDILYGDFLASSSEGGDDVLYGGNKRDRLIGGAGNDKLYGEFGNDVILGEQGDDIIYGGYGKDQLYGGEDSDTFVLAKREGIDLIRDFEVGIDFIGLAGDLSFYNIDTVQKGQNTMIQHENETLARLTGVAATDLAMSSFVPV